MKNKKDTSQLPYEKTLDKAKARWGEEFFEIKFQSGMSLYYKGKVAMLEVIRTLYNQMIQVQAIFYYGSFPKNRRTAINNSEALLRKLSIDEAQFELYKYIDKIFLTKGDTSNISQN